MWRSARFAVWRRIDLLRVNERAARPKRRAPRKNQKVLQSLAETPASKEAGYSKTLRHLQKL
jgi:hypothetical protein